MRIDVAIVDAVPLGVDTPADLDRARSLARGGRLSVSPSPMKKVVFQGEPGANSHLAVREVYPEPRAGALPDLRGLLRRGRRRATADLAMIPIENSLAGRVADIHHLLPTSRPPHRRRAFPADPFPADGAEGRDAEGHQVRVHSHIHALGQCRKIIREHRWKPVVDGDTAGAAREIAEAGDKTQAALAPRLAAELYGLDILKENVEDEAHNTTRFVILSKKDSARRRPATARSSPPSSSACGTCRRRSTRRWAASPPTAST